MKALTRQGKSEFRNQYIDYFYSIAHKSISPQFVIKSELDLDVVTSVLFLIGLHVSDFSANHECCLP